MYIGILSCWYPAIFMTLNNKKYTLYSCVGGCCGDNDPESVKKYNKKTILVYIIL